MKTCGKWLVLYMLFFVTAVTGQEIVVSKNMHIHKGASVAVFDYMTNQTDTLVNDGQLLFTKSSLFNEVPLVGTGVIEMRGDVKQELYGGADIKAHQFVLDNTSIDHVVYDANIFVENHFLFKNGLLKDIEPLDDIEPDSLFFVQLGEFATVTGVSNNSHVEGVVKKYGKNAFVMPIGDRGVYCPLFIKGSENNEMFTAKYFHCINPYPLNEVPKLVDLFEFSYWYLDSSQKEFECAIPYASPKSSAKRTHLDLAAGISEEEKLAVAQFQGLLTPNRNMLVSPTSEDMDAPSGSFNYFTASVDNSTLFIRDDQMSKWLAFASLKVTDTAFPQLVTPNGDNLNDVFDVPEKYLSSPNRIEIFNRYGNMVYVKDNYANDWDGKPNRPSLLGTDGFLPSGTYFVFFYENGELIYKNFLQLTHSR